MAFKKKQTRLIIVLTFILFGLYILLGLDHVFAEQKTVVINPGHSIGFDSGAVGNGLQEAVINSQIAAKLGTQLQQKGYKVYLTHPADGFSGNTIMTGKEAYDLKNMPAKVNAKNPDLVISIHCNSGQSSASGYEFYWSSYKENLDSENVYIVPNLWFDGLNGQRDSTLCDAAKKSKEFADILQNTFKNGLGSELSYRRTVERDDALPRGTNCPCVLIETGFISNQHDAEYLSNSSNQQKIAGCIVKGVDQFFSNNGSTGYVSSEDEFSWKLINGYWYLYNSSGAMLYGWQHVDGIWYYLSPSTGIMQTGWQFINGDWYFLESSGAMLTGWLDDGGNRYYLSASGAMVTGTQIIDGVTYIFADSGALISAEEKTELNGNGIVQGIVSVAGTVLNQFNIPIDQTVLSNIQNAAGLISNVIGNNQGVGREQIANKIGEIINQLPLIKQINTLDLSNILGSAFEKIGQVFNVLLDPQKSLVEKAGGLIEGVISVLSNSNEGWQSVNGYWLYIVSGQPVTGWYPISNIWYYFDETGIMQTSKWIDTYYYVKSDGTMAVSEWVDNDQYYVDETGRWVPGKIKSANDTFTYTAETTVMGEQKISKERMMNYFNKNNADFPSHYKNLGVSLEQFADMYIQEAKAEGVRPEFAFAQMTLETGFLKFGGQVKIGQFNFAGIGATDDGAHGFDFAKEYGNNANGIRMGIRAQIQHLKAYASTAALNNECVDPRFNLVSRGCAKSIGDFGNGKWASSTTYASNLLNRLNAM